MGKIDLSTYHVFWIKDVNHSSTFTLTYENLCHKIESLSHRLTPHFTIECYRWDKSSPNERGAICDGVVVLGTDYFKIFHELNACKAIEYPCKECSLRRKCSDTVSCREHCIIWQSNWRYA